MLGGVHAGPAGFGEAVVATVGGPRRRLADWAVGRSLAPASVSGISLVLGICAAAWFTAGTRPDNLKGTLALCAGYLAALGARELAGQVGNQVGGRPARSAAVPLPAQLAGAGRPGWLAGLSTRTSECALYAGLAIGAAAQGQGSMWPLATSVLGLVAIRETMTACSGPADPELARYGRVRRAAVTVLMMPAGGRVLLIAVAAPLWGARATLAGLLDWAIIAIGYGICTRTAARRRDRQLADGAPRPAQAEPASLAVLLQPTRHPEQAELQALRPGGQPIPVLRLQLTPPSPGAGREAETGTADGWSADSDAEQAGEDPGGEIGDDRGLAVVLRCRDDGAISRWFGRLAQGHLPPLPPALLALAAVAMLAHLGLRDLPGMLILAPAVVMLLATPGSSHRHTGRLDWLVPAILQGAQYLYIAALGVAAGVPAAVTFVLCAAIALRYADLGSGGSPALPARRRTAAGGPVPDQAVPDQAVPDRPMPDQGVPDGAPPERGAWLGWEGRMIICGLGAAMGVTMFAYFALTAYLGVLICWKVMTSSLALREGDCR